MEFFLSLLACVRELKRNHHTVKQIIINNTKNMYSYYNRCLSHKSTGYISKKKNLNPIMKANKYLKKQKYKKYKAITRSLTSKNYHNDIY